MRKSYWFASGHGSRLRPLTSTKLHKGHSRKSKFNFKTTEIRCDGFNVFRNNTESLFRGHKRPLCRRSDLGKEGSQKKRTIHIVERVS